MNHSKQLRKELLELTFPAPIKIYADGETPTANNPVNFISINNNGVARTDASKYGLIDQTLVVAVYVKLLSTGAKNTKLEEQIFNIIFNRFKETILSEGYTFKISQLSLFGNYKNITAGYSTRMININSQFINN